ncbi:hypothetical protein ROZALSC1DRAFT_25207, partial [Rozella allomycis CSF55]
KEKEKERKESESEEKEGVLNTSTATTTAADNTSLNVTFANTTLPLTSATSTTTATAATTLSPTATSSVTLLNCLADQWATMENVFVNGVKFIFRSIRREKESILRYFFNVKRKYEEYLQRPDDKQFFINKFQNYFNSFEDDQRSDNEVKNEIFLKCLELQNNLWEISEKLKEEGEVERQMIINNRWLEDHLIFNINYYLGLFQLELDRHFNTKQIVLDYFKDLEGKALDEKNTDEFKLEFLQISQEDPKIKLEQSKSIKKKKEETNDLNYFTNFISNSFNECTSKLSIEFNLDQFSTLNQSEISKIIKTDESITRKRLERIKFHATESLKEIYAKSQETFNILEEWNNNKFNAEMNSIKEMINVIQEAIEIEIPLKNQLLLFGNSFHVNSNCELEICERAVNVEPCFDTGDSDGLNAFQINHLINQLDLQSDSPADCYSFFTITSVDLMNVLQRIAVSNYSQDLLPESLLLMDYSILMNYLVSLEVGSVVWWPKFILAVANKRESGIASMVMCFVQLDLCNALRSKVNASIDVALLEAVLLSLDNEWKSTLSKTFSRITLDKTSLSQLVKTCSNFIVSEESIDSVFNELNGSDLSNLPNIIENVIGPLKHLESCPELKSKHSIETN